MLDKSITLVAPVTGRLRQRILVRYFAWIVGLFFGAQAVQAQCPLNPSSVILSGGTCPDSPFSVIVTTFTNQFYTFLHNGQPITGYVQMSTAGTGQTSLAYTVLSESPSDAGSYSVITYDSCADGNSLNLDTVYVIYSGITSLSIDLVKDTSANFHWNAGPAGSTYRWAIDTTNTFPSSGDSIFSGATPDTFTHVSGLRGSSKYYAFAAVQNANCGPVWVSNSFTTPSECTANFDSLPTISSNNSNFSICPNGKILLQSNSSKGNQWFRDGVLIPDSTGSTLTATDSGSYTVMVSDSLSCHATSPPVLVKILSSPPIPTITPSGALTFCAGDSVTLSSSSASSYLWFKNDSSLGQTGQSLLVTSSGSYSVQVTNGSACSAISAATAVVVNAVPATPTVTPSGPLTFCAGGSVILNSSSAASYLWYQNDTATTQTGQNLNVSSSGTYKVLVTNAAGCSATSASTAVTVNSLPPEPTISASGTLTFCSGDSVTLSSSASASYAWYRNDTALGQTGQKLAVTTSGSYRVAVTNANGCTSNSTTTVVTVNPIPSTPTITPGGALTFCPGGSVVLSSSTGTTYAWYRNDTALGQTSQEITATISGSYTVVITNSGGCSASSAPTVVTVNPIPPIPTISPAGALTFCPGGSVVLISSTGTAYAWYRNDTSLGQTSQEITATISGSYTVLVTSSGGCSATSTPIVVNANQVAPVPTVTPSGSLTFCAGGSVVLSSSSGTTYAWYRNDTTLGQASQDLTVTTSGSYTVLVTSSGGCSASSTPAVVTVNPAAPVPTITALGPLTFCAGGNVVLSSSSANSYAWYRNDTAIGEFVQNLTVASPGYYSVQVTSSGGCLAASDPVTVTVNSIPPIPTITGRTVLNSCSGDADTLTSSAGSGNQWLSNNSPIPGATGTFLIIHTAGNYSVEVTSAGQCSSVSSSTSVTAIGSSPQPTISPSATVTICAGDSTLLTSSLTSGNQWYKDGVALTGDTSQLLYVSVSGNYTVYGGNGLCASQSVPTVVISSGTQSTPVINVNGPLTICQGDSVQLQSSIASGNQWYFNGQALFGEKSPTYSASAAGSYIVAVGSGACQVFSTAAIVTVITNPPIPVVSYTNADLCSGAVLLASSSDSGNAWYKDTLTIPGATGPTYAPTAPGNYSVRVTYGTNCSSLSMPVTVSGSSGVIPIISINNGVLSSDSAKGNQWYLNDSIIPGANQSSFTPKFPGIYTLQFNHGGCLSNFSAPFNVTAENLTTPNVVIYPNPTTDQFTVLNKGANPVLLQLYDMAGRSILTVESISGTYQLPAYLLTRGPYYILITDQVNKNRTRFLVMKL